MSYKFFVMMCALILVGCTKRIDSTDLDHYEILKSEPVQDEVESKKTIVYSDDVQLTPIYSYKIGARVLGKENYRMGKESNVAPIDLALGWGQMSDKELLEKSEISISQGNRFYFWRVPSFSVLSRETIESHSANVHIVPASDEVTSYIKDNVDEDDVIYLEGFLVNIVGKDWTRKTSTRRNDTGAGACEILYVTKVVHLIDQE